MCGLDIIWILMVIFGHLYGLNINFLKDKEKNDNNKYNKKSTKDGVCIDEFLIILDKNYQLKIYTTYINDSVSKEEVHIFNPIVLKQRLMFIYRDSVIREVEPIFRNVTQKTANGKKVKMLECVIYGSGKIVGNNTSLYYVRGYGGCNSCSEYQGVYSLSGELLYYDYMCRWDNFYYTKGDYDSIMVKYKIPKNTLGLFVEFYPPSLPIRVTKNFLYY